MADAQEALCCDCDHRCSPNIIAGWGVCRSCRTKDRLDYSAVNMNLQSSAGREFVKGRIRAALAKEKEGAA